MAEINLSKYGITGTTEVVYNPSYEMLFEEETKSTLEGFEKGQESELGAVNVMTGVYTGRSPKDKFIVMDENSKDTVWWTSDEYKNDNHPATQEAWNSVKELALKELSNKRLFVVDAFCGANKDTRMAIRFIVEVAWQAHFVTNMFIKPTEEELKDFEPDFIVYNATKAKEEKNNYIRVVQAEEDDKEIDLVDLGYALMDKLHFIVLTFLLGAVLLNACAYFLIKPTYQSTAKLYVVSASEDSVVNLSDLNIGTSLTKDYEDLMLSYPLLEQVIAKLDLSYDYEQLADMITLENPTDTRVLKITVTSTDPEEAMNIANTLAEISVKYLPETMSTNAPNIAQVARIPDEKAGPSYLKFTLIGALLGAFLYCLVIIIRYLLDDTIHTASDMEKYFGIVPLTSIPESDQFNQGDSATDKDKAKSGLKGRSK